jgi:hypothetical protein
MRRDRARAEVSVEPLGRVWPAWAKGLVTVALGYHLAGVVVGALSDGPASPLEQAVRENLFARYFDLTDLGVSYRYYAPEPNPTPVVTARLEFTDGRPEQTVRLPDRSVWPRLRFQRQLALAFHLFSDFESSRGGPAAERGGHWAPSYARHLCRTYGASQVTLFATVHQFPPPGRVHEELERRGRLKLDLDAEEFFTVPERIGEFSCDAF